MICVFHPNQFRSIPENIRKTNELLTNWELMINWKKTYAWPNNSTTKKYIDSKEIEITTEIRYLGYQNYINLKLSI